MEVVDDLILIHFKVQSICLTRESAAFLSGLHGTKIFFFSGQPGLKGQKGIMGRYGKVGPSGMKGN